MRRRYLVVSLWAVCLGFAPLLSAQPNYTQEITENVVDPCLTMVVRERRLTEILNDTEASAIKFVKLALGPAIRDMIATVRPLVVNRSIARRVRVYQRALTSCRNAMGRALDRALQAVQ